MSTQQNIKHLENIVKLRKKTQQFICVEKQKTEKLEKLRVGKQNRTYNNLVLKQKTLGVGKQKRKTL